MKPKRPLVIHKSLPLDPALIQLNQAQSVTSYFPSMTRLTSDLLNVRSTNTVQLQNKILRLYITIVTNKKQETQCNNEDILDIIQPAGGV